jgi:hypothetical protein
MLAGPLACDSPQPFFAPANRLTKAFRTQTKGDEMKTFGLFFLLQFLMFVLVTVNFRAIAQARYGWTIFTDMLISAAQFWIIRKVGTSAENLVAWSGFVVGGAAGSSLGIYLSKKVFKKKPA